MSVTLDSPAINPSRISREGFIAVLVAANSPWKDRAGEIADVILASNHDLAFWLAIAKEEHGYGTNRESVLWRNQTNSWTNARTVQDPSLTDWEIVRDPVRGSRYVKYADVVDSVKDGIYRISSPEYVYQQQGKTSIVEVISLWTEGSWQSYSAAVVDAMNVWIERYPPVAQVDQPGYEWKYSPCYGYPIGTEGRNHVAVDRIIIHTSEGGFESGVNWLTRWPTADDEGSSTHYFLDKDGRRKKQLVRESNAAWTAGNKLFNLRGVNVEIEGRADEGDFREGMYRELANLCVGIMSRHSAIRAITREFIIGHVDVPPPSNHTDPGPHFDWDRLLRYINEARGGAPVASPAPAVSDPNAERFANGQWIVNMNHNGTPVNMLDFYEREGGIVQLGMPLEGMHFDEDGVFRQGCENVILELWTNGFGNQPGPLYRFGRYLDHVDRLRSQ